MTDMTYEPQGTPEANVPAVTEDTEGGSVATEKPEPCAPVGTEDAPVPASFEDGAQDSLPPTDRTAVPEVDYATKEAEDVLLLRAQFPEIASLSTLRELKNPARYGALRDLGLSAREAYLATGGVRSHTATDNRAHLHSAVPRTVHGTEGGISPAELSAARELFGGLNDHEIRKLYKRVTG